MVRGDEETSIDSRPSDAIALAIRAGASIFVHDHVLWESRMDPTAETDDPEADARTDRGRRIEVVGEDAPEVPFQRPAPASEDDWDQYLEGLDPEAFGKYKQ